MATSPSKVASRFLQAGGVLTFPGAEKRRPRVPQHTIGGRKYNLSTGAGPMGDLAEEEPEGMLGGGQVLRGPVSNKWKFLWVVDTDKEYVTMWRVTDGNEKSAGRTSHFMQELVKLDRKGQLNHVSNREYRIIEKHFRRIEGDHARSLKEWARSLGGGYQERVNKIAQDFFDGEFKRDLERRLRDMKRGVIPLGFELNERLLVHENERAQMQGHIISETLKGYTVKALEKHMRDKHGLDPEDVNVDGQAAHWALHDVLDDMWRRYKLF